MPSSIISPSSPVRWPTMCLPPMAPRPPRPASPGAFMPLDDFAAYSPIDHLIATGVPRTKTPPQLDIPEPLAAGPGPGNTDPRVLERFAKTGVADHMQKDVVRGMLEAKEMLGELWATKTVYTYGVPGTGFSGLDCALSLILPGDKVVTFPNGTFSGIDSLTIGMKTATAEELAADSLKRQP